MGGDTGKTYREMPEVMIPLEIAPQTGTKTVGHREEKQRSRGEP